MSWKDILSKGQQFTPGAPQLSQERQSGSSYESVQLWKAQIVSLLERNKQYPVSAQSKGEQGVVQIFFSLDRLGQVIASRIVRSSGSLALDEEVQALLRRAQPFPGPPEELAGNHVDLTVPIRFSLPEHNAQQSAPGARQPESHGQQSDPSDAVFEPNPVLMPNSPESVGQSHGPSFDCKSAKNPNEKLICQSTELAELDSNMADLVTSVMDRLNNTDRQELQKSQRSWLRERLDCGDDFTCTKEAYDERIKRLRSVLAKLSPNPPPSTKTGQLSKGDRLRVANIGPNDVLTMREYPTANSRIIDGIPPKNEEIIYLGEEQGEWIFVRYGDRAEGWVNRHFVELIVIIPPVPPGRRLQ
jgi:TonB family protein